MRSDYHARRQARIEGLRAAADRAEQNAQALQADFNYYRQDIAFLTQPGHIPARARIIRKYERGFKELDRARELRRRADATESNKAISSDDPNAPELLRAKIAREEEIHERNKKINELVRKNDREGLAAMGLSETAITRFFIPDFMGRIGIPDYEIKNRSANIRRMKERLMQLEKAATSENTEETIGEVKIVDNVTENRTQIYFPNIPPESVRSLLKCHGFHWSKTQRCWQRFRSEQARYWAKEAAKKFQAGDR